MPLNYRIHMLSAASMLGYAEQTENGYRYRLTKSGTEYCRMKAASQTQEDNALFYQILSVLHGGKPSLPTDGSVVTELSDVIFYMDFSGIFGTGSSMRQLERQKKAEAMFGPEGITLDFGSGPRTYLAFERSGNMSREARLSFLRADLCETVRRRIMLDLKVGRCQLSKLYAYNGLMLSGGTRIDAVDLTEPHRVIVVDNVIFQTNSRVITVEPDSEGAMRSYHRVEKVMDFTVTRFDGEGLVSKQLAKKIDKQYCGKHIHSSFQIRMPFVKGMVHKVDFKDFLKSGGCDTITDIFGTRHPVDEVEMILTKSMFKGYGWLTENGKSWEDYLAAFRSYDHALYITNVNKPKPEAYTTLNYQFLNTLSMTAEEFRPLDLPEGWEHSPAEEPRAWITKATEQRYYDLCANPAGRIRYFTEQGTPLGRAVKKNPLLAREPYCVKELSDAADHVLREYEVGHLTVAGDNRYLSGDLLEFLAFLLVNPNLKKKSVRTFWNVAITQHFVKNGFYAPGAVYECGDVCTLLRNPHIARNEEIQLKEYGKAHNMRKYYFGHLHGILMVDASMLAAERLGGADYDGDMVKTIADPLLNECVKRNYEFDSLDNRNNLPLLYIPAEEPVIRDADNWHDRFITVRDTFSSRVGQICNAAFNRSVIAYNENSTAMERKRCREETETLAILTGLEIDSAKSGIKPILSQYLGRGKQTRSPFLEYKTILDEDGDNAKLALKKKRDRQIYFEITNWKEITSNVERLPWLAEQLRNNTPRLKPEPVSAAELFSFAEKPDWKETLDSGILEALSELVGTYDAVLNRIRYCRSPSRVTPKRNDIDRILYSRGQEDLYDPDVLYAAVSELHPERVAALRQALTEQQWHLMDPEERLAFLSAQVPELEQWFELFSDFRSGGFRILGDLVCDTDDRTREDQQKQLIRPSDPPLFREMIQTYADEPFAKDYKQAPTALCRQKLRDLVKPRLAVRYLTALDRRDLLWILVPEEALREVKRYAE